MTSINRSKLINSLTGTGLTEKEAEVYFEGAQLHTFTPALIAKKTGIKRPTCYIILNSLIQKGFISEIPDSKASRFICVEPKSILEREKEKAELLETTVEILNQLKLKVKVDTPTINLYYGKDGVKQIYMNIIKDKPSELYCIINPDYLEKYLGYDFVLDWIKRRVGSKIQQFTLQAKEYDKQSEYANDKSKLRIVRSLPPNFSYQAMYYIWGNKVGFISDKDEGISFIVTSQEFNSLQKSMFDQIWTISV
jgi:sugar-specific transcriptional regulator TrmB